MCGGDYVFKQPWWAYGGSKTSTDLTWGYLVHCAKGHFHWYRAALTAAEIEVGRARFREIHGQSVPEQAPGLVQERWSA